jgi:hypothetical protein
MREDTGQVKEGMGEMISRKKEWQRGINEERATGEKIKDRQDRGEKRV